MPIYFFFFLRKRLGRFSRENPYALSRQRENDLTRIQLLKHTL